MGAIKIRDNYHALTGPEKAAIMFLTIGEDRSSSMMERLEEDEIRIVSRAMAGLGTITAPLLEELISQFTERMARGGAVIGNFDSAERMLSSFMPKDRVADIMNYIRGPGGRSAWERMSNVNETLLAKYLQGEHEQTIAVVLSKIAPDHAAKVLPLLPRPLVRDVIRRMVSLQSVSQEILADIEEMLHRELMIDYAQSRGGDTHEHLAEVFNRTGQDLLQDLMTDLEEDDPEAVGRIKQLMFTFEDLVELDPISLGTVIRSCDTDLLVYALKACDEETRQIFLSHMSQRAGAILIETTESLGPVLSRDVEAAKTAIVRKAKELAEAGTIVIQRDGEGDGIIY